MREIKFRAQDKVDEYIGIDENGVQFDILKARLRGHDWPVHETSKLARD
jgi:hypothetical protein